MAVKDDLVQPLSLGLFRSDYLLHDAESSDNANAELGSRKSGKLELKQVEFNTISASFGALCTKVSGLHRHVSATTGYLGVDEGLERWEENLPLNKAQNVLVGGLEAAHVAYLSQQQQHGGSKDDVRGKSKSVYVLFVVQEGERNAFDQRPLEHALQAKGIRVIRQTFAEIAARIIPSSPSGGEGGGRQLFLNHPVLGKVEVSVVYYRAGYGPSDYTSTSDWQTRKTLELSAAIKCPSIAVQLAGAKKVQQVLAEADELAPLLYSLPATAKGQVKEEELRETFTDLYPLDDSPLGQKGYELAKTQPEGFVFETTKRRRRKQRLTAKTSPLSSPKLETSSSSSTEEAVAKRQAYILMSLIKPPSGLGNYLVKAALPGTPGTPGVKGGAVLAKDTVSELGVYGAILFSNAAKSEGGVEVKHHESGGYLLRTKGRESDEGGVAVGFSVIDSPLLI